MSTSRWQRESVEIGPDLKLFRARFDLMRNPRNNHLERMVILQSNDAAQVVCHTTQREIIFVRQYRFGLEQFTLELPGGILHFDEDPATGAARELLEETGYQSPSVIMIGKNGSNPVFQNSYIFTFLAEEATCKVGQEMDPGENVEVVRLPERTVREKLLSGEFLHPHTVTGLLHFFGRQLL